MPAGSVGLVGSAGVVGGSKAPRLVTVRANHSDMANLAGRRRHFIRTKPHRLNRKGGYFR